MDAKIFGLKGWTETAENGTVMVTIRNDAAEKAELSFELTAAEAVHLTGWTPVPAIHAAE